MNKNNFMVLGIFLAGCVTAKFIPIEIPKANAKLTEKRENWCVTTRSAVDISVIDPMDQEDLDKLNTFVNKSGQQGWIVQNYIRSTSVNYISAVCFYRSI